jgi:hypothetical protein
VLTLAAAGVQSNRKVHHLCKGRPPSAVALTPFHPQPPPERPRKEPLPQRGCCPILCYAKKNARQRFVSAGSLVGLILLVSTPLLAPITSAFQPRRKIGAPLSSSWTTNCSKRIRLTSIKEGMIGGAHKAGFRNRHPDKIGIVGSPFQRRVWLRIEQPSARLIFDSRHGARHGYTVVPGTYSMFVWRPALASFLQQILRR